MKFIIPYYIYGLLYGLFIVFVTHIFVITYIKHFRLKNTINNSHAYINVLFKSIVTVKPTKFSLFMV